MSQPIIVRSVNELIDWLEEEKIEYANDTVDDIISELNDFFKDYEINI